MIRWPVLAVIAILGLQEQPSGISEGSGTFRLLRSLSGPSGTVVGAKFVFDETRSRFVFPADSSLVVYFEWEGPPGKHALTGLWKDPSGKTASISPDIQMQTEGPQFNAYWVYQVVEGMPSGVWTLEVRIDGQPAGSHAFELVVPEPKKPLPPSVPKPPPKPTMDEIFRRVSSSLTWVYKLDEQGRRSDSSSGFVIAPDCVATAFQSIDSASRLEIEFADGRRTQTDEIWACHRLEDWALVKVDTTGASPLRRGGPESVVIGERLITFNVDAGQVRVIGGVDIAGRRSVPDFGDRIQFSPALTSGAAGAPLLNLDGDVVGILGGSMFPGARPGRDSQAYSFAFILGMNSWNSATPLSIVPVNTPPAPVTLKALADGGALTPPVRPAPVFLSGVAAREAPKGNSLAAPLPVTEFSRRDARVFVYSMWLRDGKVRSGEISARVYDVRNKLAVVSTPKKVNLPSGSPLRHTIDFSPASMTPGLYRVDILWDGQPVWRSFFQIVD